MKDGEKEWARHAKEIEAGTRKSFAAHLEERGLIHDVVGYVNTVILCYRDYLGLRTHTDHMQRTGAAT